VEAWEKEGAERRRRSWLWRSTWTILIVVMVVILFGLTWGEWQSEADIVRMALMDQDGGFGHLHRSLLLDEDVVGRMRLPDDIKSVLSGIQERRRSRPADLPEPIEPAIMPASHQDDERLRALDEL
jgi:hypothetical protein